MSNRAIMAMSDIVAEYNRACQLHPCWPACPIHGAAIVAEEAGETVKAALDTVYHGASIEDIKTEAIQTAATCIRLLEHLEAE